MLREVLLQAFMLAAGLTLVGDGLHLIIAHGDISDGLQSIGIGLALLRFL